VKHLNHGSSAFSDSKEKLREQTAHGIGRGMKVSKEAIVGLLVALDNLTKIGFQKEAGLIAALKEHRSKVAIPLGSWRSK